MQLVFKFLSMAGELNTGYRTKFNCSWQSETTCMFDVLNSFTRLTDERADRKALTTPCVALHAVLRWKLLWSVAQLDQTAVYVTKLSHIRLLLSLGWRHFLIKPGGATFLPPPLPPDNIRVMVIVWRLRGNYQNCSVLCWWHNVHSQQHT